MTLFIHFNHLSKFEKLYNGSEFLQSVVDRWTGIKWMFKAKDRAEIEKLLKGRNINYDIK